jgi:hypothetical protein
MDFQGIAISNLEKIISISDVQHFMSESASRPLMDFGD